MKPPGIPHDETARLDALKAYGILDTGADPAFDNLTALAARVLGVPIALVSLVDADRQWFKSRHGLEAAETSREVSFCGHVVEQHESLVVPDALEDARFADNPLVTGAPHFRFYAGMPLRTGDGLIVGALCTIDHVPRQPTPEQLECLSLLADQVVHQLEAHRGRIQLATEHAKAVDAVRHREVLFEAMAEGVVVQDHNGAIIETNPSAERILGLTLDQMSGRSSLDPRWRSIREGGAPFPGEEHPAMATLASQRPTLNTVMGVHKPDGALTWININSLPLFEDVDGAPLRVISTFHDITALKTASAAATRLAEQEHLITTGTLAAGVGHEINNPLAFIMVNVEFVIEELASFAGGSPTGRLRELIDVLTETRDGIETIRRIVRGLKALARQESDAVPTEVENAVELAINMTGHELRHKATLSKRLGRTPLVLADDSRLTQVLVNLLVNAAQAFASGDIDQNHIWVASAVDGGFVEITVKDNGPGIPTETQRRVFDPFFTTKAVGQGTGLGLSISRSIVTALGGTLTLESEVGVGTTVRILLPAAATVEPVSKERSNTETQPRGRVLVVDDDVNVLRSIQRSLSREHDVTAITDPRRALEVLQGGAVFDVVFCDVVMPHVGGEQLYASVLQSAPTIAERFVFISGGAVDAAARNFLARVPNERIEKPFSIQNLQGIARRFTRARQT